MSMGSTAVRSMRLVALFGAVTVFMSALAMPNAGAAGVVYVDEGFEGSNWATSSTWSNWLSGGYLASQTVPGVVGDATRITMKPGRHEAAMLNYQFSVHGHAQPDEAWFRYWMRFDALPEDGGKLPGFMALYSDSARGQVKPTESKPGWSARTLFGPGDAGTNVKLGYYLYWLGQAGTAGDGLWWSKQVPVGQWVCVEGHTRMNTPGSDDGQLDAWMDSEKVFERSDIRYRSASQTGVHIRDFMFEVWYGGAPTPPEDTPVSFDGLVVADHRVGCDLPSGSFLDTQDSPFTADIEWLADVGVTKGCNPPANTRFCPDDAVTRGQMAAFLHRAFDDIISVPPPPAPPPAPPTAWGVETADYAGSLSTMASEGHPLDMIHVEYPLSGGDWLATGISSRSFWVPLQLSNIRDGGAVPYIEFYDSDISGFNAGRYDAEFDGWLDTIVGWFDESPSNRALIVPFPDANNKNTAYGDDAPALRAAYRKVHDAIRSRGVGPSQARFVFQLSAELNSDRYSNAAVGTGFGAFSPGSDVIDMAAVSWLNDGTPTWDDWGSLFSARVDEIGSRLGPDVPVLLGVVASTPSAQGQDRAGWLSGLASGIRSSQTAIGFVYLDKDRSIAYSIDSASSPDPALLTALDILDSPNDRLSWFFGGVDAWRAAMRASSPVGVFTDDDTSVFESDIAWLANSGITKGCAATRFCPDDRVTRGQMAAFLHRALGGLLVPSGTPSSFVDTSGSLFAEDIAWLAATGITKGCDPPANTRFCPDSTVTRGQMAAFLHRALGDILG
jgi:Polysaccharide lyase 14/S-layer homology domain